MSAETKTLNRCRTCRSVTPLTWCPKPGCGGAVQPLTRDQQEAYIRAGHPALDAETRPIRCMDCDTRFYDAPDGWECPECGGPVCQRPSIYQRR